ncbi:MAG: DUF6174 domain-containing protein [bacterium]
MRWTGFGFALFLLSMLGGACDERRVLDFKDSQEAAALQISHYEFEQRVLCFCAPPAGQFHKLTVSDDRLVLVDDREPTEAEVHTFKTISQLFEFVESIDPDSVAVLRVEYDETYGFPSDIYVDYDSRIVDEEIRYESKNFKEL